MSLISIVLLLLLGIVFLLLEILVFPGTGFSGIIGFALMGICVWQIYIGFGTTAGHWSLAGVGVLTVAAIWIALSPKTWNRVSLKSEIDGVAVPSPKNIKKGDVGVAISRLAPMGKVDFDGEFVEVKTYGQFIDEKSKVTIIKIEHNSVYVKLMTAEDE